MPERESAQRRASATRLGVTHGFGFGFSRSARGAGSPPAGGQPTVASGPRTSRACDPAAGARASAASATTSARANRDLIPAR